MPERPTNLDYSTTGPTVLAVGACEGAFLYIFFTTVLFSLINFSSFSERRLDIDGKYRLKLL